MWISNASYQVEFHVSPSTHLLPLFLLFCKVIIFVLCNQGQVRVHLKHAAPQLSRRGKEGGGAGSMGARGDGKHGGSGGMGSMGGGGAVQKQRSRAIQAGSEQSTTLGAKQPYSERSATSMPKKGLNHSKHSEADSSDCKPAE